MGVRSEHCLRLLRVDHRRDLRRLVAWMKSVMFSVTTQLRFIEPRLATAADEPPEKHLAGSKTLRHATMRELVS
jgi:hypothetical protein